MSAIIPFDFSAPVAARSRRPNSINQDALLSSGFPVISIKGKVFAIVKDGERRVLTRVIDDEEVPVSSLSLAVIRANIKARVFYGKAYVEGADEGTKPACFSHDGVHPDAQAEHPQATNCQLCPHSQWDTKLSADGTPGKGTACTVNTRLAVCDPKAPDTIFLLRAPAGSRKNFSEAVRLADSHGKDYNEVVMRIGFDSEAPAPKLTFKPTGLLGDEVFEKISAKYDDPVVLDIVGTPSPRMAEEVPAAALPAPAKAKPAVSEDELESALTAPVPTPAAAKPAVKRAAAKPAPAPAEPAPAKAAAAPADPAGLLTELGALLGASDD